MEQLSNLLITEKVDKDVAVRTNLICYGPNKGYKQMYRTCQRVQTYQMHSACIPSRYLENFRIAFPDITLGVWANYPYNYHCSNVAIREVQGIIALCEDISNIEVGLAAPKDYFDFLDVFAELNYLAPLKLLLPWDLFEYQLSKLPPNVQKYPAFKYLQLNIPEGVIGVNTEILTNRIKLLTDKGYKYIIGGDILQYNVARDLIQSGANLLESSNSSIIYHREYTYVESTSDTNL